MRNFKVRSRDKRYTLILSRWMFLWLTTNICCGHAFCNASFSLAFSLSILFPTISSGTEELSAFSFSTASAYILLPPLSSTYVSETRFLPEVSLKLSESLILRSPFLDLVSRAYVNMWRCEIFFKKALFQREVGKISDGSTG